MVRSSHTHLALVALVPLLLLSACGGEQPAGFELVLDDAGPATLEVPFPVAVLTGRATDVETLTLKVSASDETYSLPLRPGTAMAFRLRAAAERPPVKLEGLSTDVPSADDFARALERRLRAEVPEAVIRQPAGEGAFVVDLPVDREERWPGLVRAASPRVDVRFLMEVLPITQYRDWRGGERPPRLESGPAPWAGTAEEFSVFKEAEVVRWRAAQDAGRPYEPSRSTLLVLPRFGTEAAGVEDFAVLEWSEDPGQQFDGRMLANPQTARDPQTGKPVVLYDVRADWHDRFQAWTAANVGLPMAIVVDWVHRSAPVINSPLRDNVQITLGQGSYAELQAEADALTGALRGLKGGPGAMLVAVCTWQTTGEFELLLPLEPRVDTTVSLQAKGQAATDQADVRATLRLVPGLDAEAHDTVDAVLAEMCLGALNSEQATPRLAGSGEAAVERLSEVAGGDGTAVRRLLATDLLGRVDASSEAAITRLVSLVQGDDPERAAVAVRGLARSAGANDEAFDALFEAATADDEFVRRAALHSLQAVRDPRRAELLGRLDDENLRVRQAVLLALGAFGVDGEGDWESWLLPAFLSRLEDEDVGMRRTALMYLDQLVSMEAKGVTDHLPEVAALLADESLEVRLQAAGLLGRLGAAALPALRPHLAAERAEVRAAALAALVGIEEPSAEVKGLIEAGYDDEALQVRLAAASSLAMRGGDLSRALPVAREGLASDDDVERRIALGILWWAGKRAPEAAPWLEPLLDDEDDTNRVLAAAALKRMDRETERSRQVLSEVVQNARHPMHGLAVSLEQKSRAEEAEKADGSE